MNETIGADDRDSGASTPNRGGRCQCNRTAFDHSPGNCPTTWGLRRFDRNGVELLLCRNCDFSTDVPLDEELPDE